MLLERPEEIASVYRDGTVVKSLSHVALVIHEFSVGGPKGDVSGKQPQTPLNKELCRHSLAVNIGLQ